MPRNCTHSSYRNQTVDLLVSWGVWKNSLAGEKYMLIKACLNGARKAGEHPALPVSAEELAGAAQAAVAAGAGALHMHPRDASGKETLTADDQAAALVAIRTICPGIPVGVSTGLWIEPDVSLRLRHIQAWTVRPNFASVNFSEPGVVDLCDALLSQGIGVEAGIANEVDAQLLVNLQLASDCLRILIEPDGDTPAAALATSEHIIRILDEAGIRTPRLLHGQESTAWPVLEAALLRGYDTRIGLEDTLTLPDGSIAIDNAHLVSIAINMAKSHQGS
jgi:uncharacterized protein (DUF849 family)